MKISDIRGGIGYLRKPVTAYYEVADSEEYNQMITVALRTVDGPGSRSISEVINSLDPELRTKYHSVLKENAMRSIDLLSAASDFMCGIDMEQFDDLKSSVKILELKELVEFGNQLLAISEASNDLCDMSEELKLITDPNILEYFKAMASIFLDLARYIFKEILPGKLGFS